MVLSRLNADLAGVVSNAHRSLVAVRTGRGHGAGTIWHPDGLIITNAHVVANSPMLNVLLPDGAELPAKVLAHSDEYDLAALVVEANNLPTIESGDSKALQPGEWVIAAGHPFGIRGAVTHGVVIGTGAELPERPAHGSDWLAMSLHLRPGHSGGPVVNIDGELVGVNTIMAGPEVGIAVPAHIVRDFLRHTIGQMDRPKAAV